jgi:hypothetical protein
MNFKKLLIIVAVVVVLVGSWKYFTRVDRTNAVAVANAFTKAMKSKDTSAASGFYHPGQASQWREQTDEKLSGMRSGAKERFFERIPETPEFSAPVTTAGKTMVVSADKQYSLEMTQVDGKWYVAKE